MNALKEWAVACKALEEGAQTVILRKGGILEYRSGFEVKHSAFWLFPTFEHQSKESLKPQYWPLFDGVSNGPQGGEQIVLSSYAKVAHVFEITNPGGLESIDKFHIWSKNYIAQRMAYNPSKPMSVIVLRVFKSDKPVTVMNRPEWAGCKSWVPLEAEGEGNAVLSDNEFEAASSRVREALPLPA